jgi:hypothetical protein
MPTTSSVRHEEGEEEIVVSTWKIMKQSAWWKLPLLMCLTALIFPAWLFMIVQFFAEVESVRSHEEHLANAKRRGGRDISGILRMEDSTGFTYFD